MNHYLDIPGEKIDGNKFACLGTQLICVFSKCEVIAGPLSWYGADIEFTGASSIQQEERAPRLIGNTALLIELSQSVDQYYRGVFIAVKTDLANPQFRDWVDTEDPVDMELESAILEIRAFDTHFIELITREEKIAVMMSEFFGVPVMSAT